MSADLLRRAAALMRERAEAARAGRWEADNAAVTAVWRHGPHPVAMCAGSLPIGNALNAEHIASWHPAVALAVADWLDSSADVIDGHTEAGVPVPVVPPGCYAVARSYLGDSA